MKDSKMLYVILGFGCGVVLCGSIGLIASLNTDMYVEEQVKLASNDKKDKTEYDNKEYKIEQYADKTEEENSQKDINPESKDEVLSSKVEETQEILEIQKTDEVKEIKDVQQTQETEEVEPVLETTESYVYVEIPTYFGATQICELLEEKGIVDNANEFLAFIRKEDKQTMLLDGNLKLQYGLTYKEVLSVLTRNN